MHHQVENLVVNEGLARNVEGNVAEQHAEAHQGEGRRKSEHDDDDAANLGREEDAQPAHQRAEHELHKTGTDQEEGDAARPLRQSCRDDERDVDRVGMEHDQQAAAKLRLQRRADAEHQQRGGEHGELIGRREVQRLGDDHHIEEVYEDDGRVLEGEDADRQGRRSFVIRVLQIAWPLRHQLLTPEPTAQRRSGLRQAHKHGRENPTSAMRNPPPSVLAISAISSRRIEP